jgi:hypothetical protein
MGAMKQGDKTPRNVPAKTALKAGFRAERAPNGGK